MRTAASTSRSAPAFDAAYGLDGRSGSSSVDVAPRRDVAVHLVGRDLDEPRAARLRPLEQDVRAEHVRANERRALEDRAVDVRLGGEVHDRLGALPRRGDGVGIRDVPLDELVLDALEVGRVPGVGELVEDDDLVPRGDEPPHEVAADEAAPTGDENAHGGMLTAVELDIA